MRTALIILGFILPVLSFSQTATAKPRVNGWHLLDPAKDGYLGISLEKAYDLLKGRPSRTVIVAVIDSGVDTAQEDLKDVLWVNAKEIASNGKDDDGNGYVDDVHGWNFCGARDGKNLAHNTHEIARVYHNWKSEFEGVKEKKVPADRKYLFQQWTKAATLIEKDYKAAIKELPEMKEIATVLTASSAMITDKLGKEAYKAGDIKKLQASAQDQLKAAVDLWTNVFNNSSDTSVTQLTIIDEVNGYKGRLETQIARKTTPPEDFRGALVKDNYTDINDKFYGNHNLTEGSGDHGTLVSGTIGATRGNGIGMDGIADNVRIMAIRAVPGGDEHDKDVALAIRYAVDNGAKVINMSFGKPVSPYKNLVDDAVRYAESKNVLLVHGSGNDGKDITSDHFYPNPEYIDGARATNYLTVSASGDASTGALAAGFSNYSKSNVDLFAPGVHIYATATGNRYVGADGTSLASPVAAGVAALLLSYFPELTPSQIITILKESGTPVNEDVVIPGEGDKKAAFKNLSSSGKIINAYGAVQMALSKSK